MEHKRSRSPHQLADSPSIERCPAYGHRHERLDQRIEMIDSTATADACPDSLGAGGEGRDTKVVWNLVIGASPSAPSWNNPVSPSSRLLESGLRKASWHAEFTTFLLPWNRGCLPDTSNVCTTL